jgi:hypothetical protein
MPPMARPEAQPGKNWSAMARNAAPAVGEVLKETKFTQLVPATTEKTKESRWVEYSGGVRPAFFDYCEMRNTPEKWTQNWLSLKRYEGSEKVYLETLDGESLAGMFSAGKPFSEEWIKQEYGGGKFFIMMKENGELIYGGHECKFAGEPRDPSKPRVNSYGPGFTMDANGNMMLVMNKMLETMDHITRRLENNGNAGQSLIAEAARDALGIQKTGLTSLATVAPQPTVREPNPMDDMMRQFMTAAINKMMNPPATNAVTETLQLITALKDAGLVGGGESKGNMWVELLRNAPAILGELNEGFKTMGAAQTAQIAAAERARAVASNLPAATYATQNPTVAPTPRPATVPNPVQPAAPAPAAPSRTAAGAPTPEQVQQIQLITLHHNVANIIMSEPLLTVEECVARVIVLLEANDVNLPTGLAALGENGLAQMFNQPPYLSTIPKGDRLNAFIKLFISEVAAAQVDDKIPPQKPN